MNCILLFFASGLLLLPGAYPSVWPQPQHARYAADQPLLYLTRATAFVVDGDADRYATNAVLRASVSRYTSLLQRFRFQSSVYSAEHAHGLHAHGLRPRDNIAPAPAQRLHLIKVRVASSDDTLSVTTSYAYAVHLQSADNATITADTCFGAAHALETVLQLFETTSQSQGGGIFPVEIQDYPSYPWRGVMLDVGRRFAPVPMIENLLDTMAAVKLSVLHLHASDYCRFAIESKRFPQLGSALRPGTPDAGMYSQQEIRELIRYAKLRGIRIVPEFDLPGHVFRWASVLQATGTGLALCRGTDYTVHHNASTNASYAVLHNLLGEMAELFDDDVMHVGMDEVGDPAPCSANGTLALERMLVDAVVHDFGKTVMGWNPITRVMQEKGEKNQNIVNSYMSNAAAGLVEQGYSVVDSESSHWYFTHPAGWDQHRVECAGGCVGARGWEMCWHPPGGDGGGIGEKRSAGGFGKGGKGGGRLLGGEMSLWTDDYVRRECGAHGPSLGLANGSCFYGREMDKGFQQSLGGLTWPRGLVAAGAFYNYNSTLNASSAAFAERIHKLNDALQRRGAFVCASGAACSYVGEGNRLYPGVDAQKLDGYSCSAQKK